MRSVKDLLLGTAVLAVLSTGAYAADLSVPVAAPAAAPPASSWDGPYIGANVGYAWGHSDHSSINTTIGDFDMSGGFVGGQIGYNFHLTDGVVMGVQGDLEWANITGSQTQAPNNITDTINWTGAVTGRLGYDAGQFLPYILGGVAFANSTRHDIFAASVSETHTGWTVGAGVEAMLADNLSGFVEYRYSDYGAATYTGLATAGEAAPGVTLTDSTVRAGLNFHF